jgi:hypothetical protein
VTPISSESSRSAGKIDPGGNLFSQMERTIYFSAKLAGPLALMIISLHILLLNNGETIALIIPERWKIKTIVYSGRSLRLFFNLL